jgi:hypothetical protein
MSHLNHQKGAKSWSKYQEDSFEVGSFVLDCLKTPIQRKVISLKYLVVIALMTALIMLVKGCGDPAWGESMNLTASWYSIESLRREGTTAYSNNIMANGEIFQDEKMVAASRDYSLGKKVRVANIANGKSIVVTVTDRTNKRFKGKRIDLSKKAFSLLADLKQGVIQVHVRAI